MLLKIKTDKKITATVTLDESIINKVHQYSAYTKATADDVVNSSLEYVFAADKDFAKFCTENASAKASVPLRIKTPAKQATKPGKSTPSASVASSIVR